jgi:serine/threonine protein kinase
MKTVPLEGAKSAYESSQKLFAAGTDQWDYYYASKDTLGKGSFGSVIKGFRIKTYKAGAKDQPQPQPQTTPNPEDGVSWVAIKRISKEQFIKNPFYKDYSNDEVLTMYRIKNYLDENCNPYVLKCYDFLVGKKDEQGNENRYFITELCAGTTADLPFGVVSKWRGKTIYD